MPAEPSLRDLLNVCTDAAYLAGRRTLAYFNAEVAVEHKHDDTPVTKADREAELVIRERVGKYFPAHSIIGEEHGRTEGTNPHYRWIIDPIDGTKSFIHGVPLYGVMIGVEVRGRPSVGAVYLAALDEMISAADGLGCTWNGRTARCSDVSKIEDATILAGSITRAIVRSDAYERLAGAARLNRGWGDCYGYMLVATGRAEVMLDPAINPWDCAPLPPILREAGGRFTTWAGEETIWGPDGVATNNALNKQVLAVLKSEKRAAKHPAAARGLAERHVQLHPQSRERLNPARGACRRDTPVPIRYPTTRPVRPSLSRLRRRTIRRTTNRRTRKADHDPRHRRHRHHGR